MSNELPSCTCSLRETPGFDELKASRTASASVDGLSKVLRGLSTGRQPSLWQDLPGYSGRVSWVVGEEDTKFVEIARNVEPRVSKQWTFEEVEGCGHAVHLEKEAALVELLRDWLSNGCGKNGEDASKQVAEAKSLVDNEGFLE